jgi:septal ring factor EnvC (AmiA/AmiB activator)
MSVKQLRKDLETVKRAIAPRNKEPTELNHLLKQMEARRKQIENMTVEEKRKEAEEINCYYDTVELPSNMEMYRESLRKSDLRNLNLPIEAN